jgi:hypothetical protein
MRLSRQTAGDPGRQALSRRLQVVPSTKRRPIFESSKDSRSRLAAMKEKPMHFDPETVALLRATLDRAWASLPLKQQAKTSRSELAERILKAAAKGERDPERLHASSILNESAVKARIELFGVVAGSSTPMNWRPRRG